MFYYVEPSSVFLKTLFYTKTKVLLKPGLQSSVIPPIGLHSFCVKTFRLLKDLEQKYTL